MKNKFEKELDNHIIETSQNEGRKTTKILIPSYLVSSFLICCIGKFYLNLDYFTVCLNFFIFIFWAIVVIFITRRIMVKTKVTDKDRLEHYRGYLRYKETEREKSKLEKNLGRRIEE